jgi:ribonucleotide reductase alpha subunit
MNLYVEDTDLAKMTNMHFYGWKKGLKTGVYYTRTRPKAKTMAFSIDPRLAASKGVSAAAVAETKPTEEEVAACSRENPEGCLMCSA